MKPQLVTIALVTALAASTGCDHSSPTPRPTPTPAPATPAPAPTNPAPAPSPQVTSLRITGNGTLTSVGATSALAATATMSDGTTQDLTTGVLWRSSDPSSIAVSPSGVVTALRFGSSYVLAQSGTKNATLNVLATPSGTFVVFGWVREPGSGAIANVLVREATSGLSVASDADGVYSLGNLTAGRMAFTKDGYEPVSADSTPNTALEVAMQRVVRIAAGNKVDVKLAPHDMDYEAAPGSHCYPCRMIRVTSSGAPSVHLSVTWNEPRATLNMWINGQLFEGATHGPSETATDLPAGPGELIVYVGPRTGGDYYIPFTLTTVIK
jgi:hypothetical protein